MSAWSVSPPVVAVLLMLAPVAILAHADYRHWHNLGPGGLPHNVVGWTLQSLLRLMCSSDVKGLAYYEQYAAGSEAHNYLSRSLNKRQGEHPAVGKWAAPHRQLDMQGNPGLKQSLCRAFDDAAAKNPGVLSSGPSIIEGGSPALFISSKRDLPRHDYYKKAPYEVIHMHQTDGSLHCILSAADAKLLVQKGWGERHGLNGKFGFPRGYLMVYAPRNESELKVVRAVINAAARYGLDGEALLGG